MISRGLIISLGITLIASTVLFLYFRNRIGKIEKKVNLMFQLIQEHNTARELSQQRMESSPPLQKDPSTETVGGSLIEISDDEGPTADDDSDSQPSSGSDDESDIDEDVKLTIGNADGQDPNALADIKTISLTLDGAEVSGNGDSATIDDLDEISDIGDDVQPVDDVGTTNATDDQKGPDEQPDNNKYLVVGETAPSNSNTSELGKMKVSALKELAAKKGLTNFKSLRKPKLIELLQSNE